MNLSQTNRKWWTLGAVCVATFMLLLDITVVNTALPAIQKDLGGSFTDLQWVIDAYALSLAALVLTAGSLADRLGRRRVFAAGLAIFSVASLLCALAPDPTFLNLARGLQGIGGAVMFAVSLALVAQEFPSGAERGMAMGIYGATIGVAVAIGPLVGGLLTDGLGWQSVFLINVPIGAAAVAVTYWKLAESRDPDATRIDWAGLLTFSTALLLLVLALVRGNDEGWGSALIVSLFAAAAALLVAFAAIEQRVAEPMLPLSLFRRRAFTGVQLAAFAVSGSLFALFLFLTLYLQSFLGYSPVEAGARYLPMTIASFIVAPLSGMALARVQARYLMSGGLALCGLGLLLTTGLGLSSDWTALLAGFVISGIGVGLLNPVIADVALSVVPKERSGMAAGINDTFRQVGIAVGIAAWGAIFLGAGADQDAPGGGRRGRRHRSAAAGRSDLLGGAAPGGRGGAAGDANGRPERGRTGLPAWPQRDPAARWAALPRRRGAGPVAGARGRDRARGRGGGAGASAGGRSSVSPSGRGWRGSRERRVLCTQATDDAARRVRRDSLGCRA
jgi:EmrB/QacA subfamily drug resistance transporter